MEGIALVLGSAECLWLDMARALPLLAGRRPLIVAANHAGLVWEGPLDHWASVHPSRFAGWLARRAGADRPQLWTTRYPVDNHEPVPPELEIRAIEPVWGRHGSAGGSGLLALQVALEVAPKAVLCGMPIDNGPYAAGSDLEPIDHLMFRRAWEECCAKFADRTRSVSGWTKDLFGAPTPEWIMMATDNARGAG